MARKFLHIIVGLIVLIIAGLVLLRLYAQDLTEIAFVPSAEFADQPPLPVAGYDNPNMWFARPGMPKDPSRWVPDNYAELQSRSAKAPANETVDAAVFFVHPTALVSRDSWNDTLKDDVSHERSRLYVKGMASVFNASPDLWAPRYRQAAIGAFLTDAPEASKALDLAYRDVAQAFDTFLSKVRSDQPIVLAGHSQGALHLRRLIKERVAGQPLAQRIAAAYIIGWPVSVEHDLPMMGMAACKDAASSGCVISYLSFADPADPSMMLQAYARRRGLDGLEIGENSAFLCVDPISGGSGGNSEAKNNLGTLVPDLTQGSGSLAKGVIPAQCGPDHLLHIGPPLDLEMGPYVLPGNNYHIYDMTLFWSNLRADFAGRVAAFKASRN